MTAKEKAKDLKAKFFRITPQPYSINEVDFNNKKLKFQEWDKDWTERYAKQGALIAIDEIIESQDKLVGGKVGFVNPKIAYYQEVKKEIEAI